MIYNIYYQFKHYHSVYLYQYNQTEDAIITLNNTLNLTIILAKQLHVKNKKQTIKQVSNALKTKAFFAQRVGKQTCHHALLSSCR